MSTKIDNQTLLAFHQGNEQAFELVFKTYYTKIVLFVTRVIDNKEEAEDIAMNIFSFVYKQKLLFDSEAHLLSYLYRSARNSSLNYLTAMQRKGQRMKELAAYMQDDTFLEYEYSIKEVIVENIYQAIETLPQESKRIFKLLYYEELTPNEVAAMLQISVNTVYTQRRRAVKSLRLLLSENSLALFWLMYPLAMLEIRYVVPSHVQ